MLQLLGKEVFIEGQADRRKLDTITSRRRFERIDQSICALFRMNNTCVILVLFLAIVSCTLSSYLDIPPPPERPMRFKTKEQIETYLKAVKDYYDAFKIKLVRRDHLPTDQSSSSDDESSTTEQFNDSIDFFKRFYHDYRENPSLRPADRQRQYRL